MTSQKDEWIKSLADLTQVDNEKVRRLYEIAQIKTLAETKRKIIQWAGAWAVILAIVTAVLGAFGVDQMIRNRVVTQVSHELANQRERIENAKHILSSSLGQVEAQRQQVDEALKTAASLEQEYRNTISEIAPLVQDLTELERVTNFKVALYGILAEFYTIRSFHVGINVAFVKEVTELVEEHGYSMNELMFSSLDLQTKENGEYRDVAQFFSEDSPTIVDSKNLHYSFELYAPFKERVLGVAMNEVRFNSVKFRKDISSDNLAGRQIRAYSFIDSIKVQVNVNDVPIVVEEIDGPEFAREQMEFGGQQATLVMTRLDRDSGYWELKELFDVAVSRRLEEEMSKISGQ